MTNENANQQQQQQNQQNQQQQKNQSQEGNEETISLNVKDYEMLLDKLDEVIADNKALKGKVGGGEGEKDENEDKDLDTLISDAKKGGKAKEVNLDNLTPKEIVAYVQNMVGQEVMDLRVTLHAMRLEREIETLTAQEKYKDLYDYEEGIYKAMKANPKLTVKQAYLIAKDAAPSKKHKDEGEDEEEDRRPRFLRDLPDPRRKSYGERPGAARSTTDTGSAKTIEDAAEKAFDEVFGGGKKK